MSREPAPLASEAQSTSAPASPLVPASRTQSSRDLNDATLAEEPFGTGEHRELQVPGFLPAVVYVPNASEPRRLVVAAHGAGGMPEGECEYWRRLTRGNSFILCLRGKRTNILYPSGYYYPTHFALEREFRAALGALRNEYATRIAPENAIYAGFSQGAIMGAPMIVAHAAEFPNLVLIEGGYEYWSVPNARKFAKKGGKRVLFACGTRWCATKAKIPAAWLRRYEVDVRIEYAPGAGHTPGGAVMTLTEQALPWVLGENRTFRN